MLVEIKATHISHNLLVEPGVRSQGSLLDLNMAVWSERRSEMDAESYYSDVKLHAALNACESGCEKVCVYAYRQCLSF